MAFEVSGRVEGVPEMIATMRNIAARVQKKALKKGVNAASKLLLRKAKSAVRVETGLLKRSLGRKVKTFRNTGAVVAIVGPRVGFKMEVTRGKRTVLSNPTKYAHLVELGTARSAAFPFLGPAFESSKAEARALIAEAVNEAITSSGK